eukprot:26176_5
MQSRVFWRRVGIRVSRRVRRMATSERASMRAILSVRGVRENTLYFLLFHPRTSTCFVFPNEIWRSLLLPIRYEFIPNRVYTQLV